MAYTKSKEEKKAISIFCSQLYNQHGEFFKSKDYSEQWKCKDRFCICCNQVPTLLVKKINSVVFENESISDFLNLN